MITGHTLARADIGRIWQIDRSEVIEAVYILVDGALVLRPDHFEATGWPPGESQQYTPILEACYDRGGWFYGLFDEQRLVGIVVLDTRALGTDLQQRQLLFLHIDHAYRGQG
ncbi:MAG TPA: hypothetical protein PKC19_20520, partial [Roseiflexaceae bacterium]|nr:hypothetical protein [Roseiflexaceae bacterium]